MIHNQPLSATTELLFPFPTKDAEGCHCLAGGRDTEGRVWQGPTRELWSLGSPLRMGAGCQGSQPCDKRVGTPAPGQGREARDGIHANHQRPNESRLCDGAFLKTQRPGYGEPLRWGTRTQPRWGDPIRHVGTETPMSETFPHLSFCVSSSGWSFITFHTRDLVNKLVSRGP